MQERVASALNRLLTYGVKWNVLKLTFAVGVVVGMVVEAILITVPQAALAVFGLLPGH